MRSQLEDNDVFNQTVRMGWKFGLNKTAIGGNVVLDIASPTLQMLDPGVSARNVQMPAVTKGLMFIIFNYAAATGTLVVKKVDGTTTIGTVAIGKMALVFSDGADWFYAALA